MQRIHPLLGDRPLRQAADDLLRFDRLAEGLADQVAASREPGLVAAVRSDVAGAGRTSFLNLLHAALLARGLVVLRLSRAASGDLLRDAAPLGQAAPVVLVDDADPSTLDASQAASAVVAAWTPGACLPCAGLELTLPSWGLGAAREWSRLLAESDEVDARNAWERVLVLARTPREAKRLRNAAAGALASCDDPEIEVLAAVARIASGERGRCELDAHVALYLGVRAESASAEPAGATHAPAEADDDLETLRARCSELARSADPGAARELARLLAEDRASVRPAAMHAIAQLPCLVAAPVVRPLVAHGDATVRRAAAHVLGRLGDHESLEALAALLADPSADARRAAAAALGRLGGGRAVTALLSALDDAHSGVRMAAETALSQALEELPDDASTAADEPAPLREAVAALAFVLASRHESARDAALGALARLGVGEPAAAMADLVRAGTAEERAAASAALQRMPFARDAVAPLLRHADEAVACAAAEILGKLGDPAAVDALLAAHAEAVPRVRQAAAASLVRLGWRE